MQILILASIPIVSALIGWLTNRLAIRMLFWPRRPFRFLGLRIQGLIPRRQEDVAERAGVIIEREIFSEGILRKEIQKIDIKPYIDDIALRLVWERIGPRLRSVPLAGKLVTDSLLASLTRMAVREMEKEAGPLLERLSTEAENHLDVRRIVAERIRGFDLDTLETVVQEVAAREFRSIEWAGAILGFIVGLCQLALLALSGQLALTS